MISALGTGVARASDSYCLYGDIGDDHLCGYTGSDSLFGGPGDDFLDYGSEGTSENGGPDNDECRSIAPGTNCESIWTAPECPTA